MELMLDVTSNFGANFLARSKACRKCILLNVGAKSKLVGCKFEVYYRLKLHVSRLEVR